MHFHSFIILYLSFYMSTSLSQFCRNRFAAPGCCFTAYLSCLGLGIIVQPFSQSFLRYKLHSQALRLSRDFLWDIFSVHITTYVVCLFSQSDRSISSSNTPTSASVFNVSGALLEENG